MCLGGKGNRFIVKTKTIKLTNHCSTNPNEVLWVTPYGVGQVPRIDRAL